MLVTDFSGDTLQGAIDGSNRVFKTSLPFDLDSLQVYCNGLNKLPDLDDGFEVLDSQTFRMREAREDGDTVSATYALAGTNTVGGQPDGVPPTASVYLDAPPQFAVEPASLLASDAELLPPPFCGC